MFEDMRSMGVEMLCVSSGSINTGRNARQSLVD